MLQEPAESINQLVDTGACTNRQLNSEKNGMVVCTHRRNLTLHKSTKYNMQKSRIKIVYKITTNPKKKMFTIHTYVAKDGKCKSSM